LAETIRGINIVIGAETQALTAALADVNTASRNISGELRHVQNLLRMDPGNTTLISQQQELLGQAVENTRERLERLRAAQAQVTEQFQRGEITAGQYRAFERELQSAEINLNRFENRLEQTQDTADSLSDTLQNTGEKAKGIGEKMSLAITAPIAAAGAVMLKGAIDAETATGKLQAQLGITAEEAASLGDVAQEVWKSGFGENIEEATEAIKTVRLNMGILVEGELQAVAQGAMTIADVFEQDVSVVTASAGVVMKNFGISGQDALDILTVGFQKGGDFSGELLDTMREYAPQFAAMGFTADQAMATLIAGAEQGAFNLDKIGDAAKESFLRLKDGSTGSQEAFKTLGLDTNKMAADIAGGGEKANAAFQATLLAISALEDPVARDRASIALFGTTVEDLGQGVVLAMAEGVKGLDDFQGATAEATEAMRNNNPGLALTTAMRDLQAAIGPALLPLADIITNTVVPAVKSMADWFNEMSPAGQTTVLAITGVAAALGPLLMVLGPIVSVATSVVGALGAISAAMAGGATGVAILTTAFPALGTALAVITGPIGLTVAALAALGIAGYSIYEALSEDALPAVNLFGEGVSEATEKAVGGFLDLNDKAITALNQLNWSGQAVTSEMANGIVSTFGQMKNQVVAGLQQQHNEALGEMQKYFTDSAALTDTEEAAILTKIATSYEEKKTAISDGEEAIKQILTAASAEKRALTEQEKAEINRIQYEMVSNGVNVLSQNEVEAKVIMERMKAQAGEISAQQAVEVVQNASKQKDDAVKVANEQYDKTLAWIVKQRDETGSISKEQADKLITEATRQRDDTVNKAYDMHNQVVEAAKKQAGEHVNQVNWETGEVLSKWEVFKNNSRNQWNTMITDVENAWNNMKNSAVQQAEALKVGATNKLGELWDYIKSVPSQADQWGKDIIQGLINGITSKLQAAKNAALSVGRNIKDAITGFFDMKSPSKVTEELGKYISEGLAKGIEKGTSDAEKAAQKLSQVVQSAVSTVLGDLDKTFQLQTAKLELEILSGGANLTETQRLEDELKKLQLQYDQSAEKLEALNAVYETAKDKLSENSEAVKDYKQQLELAKIAHEKLGIEISNNRFAQEKAAIEENISVLQEMSDAAKETYEETLKAATDAYRKAEDLSKESINLAKDERDEKIQAAKDYADEQKEYYQGIYDAAKETYDNIIESAESYRDSELSALQSQLDTINDEESQRDKDSERSQLELAVAKARTTKDRTKAEADLAEWLRKQEVEAKKESLKAQMDKVKADYVEKERIAKNDLSRAEQRYQDDTRNLDRETENKLAIIESQYQQKLSMAKTDLANIKKIYDEEELKAKATFQAITGYAIERYDAEKKKQDELKKNLNDYYTELAQLSNEYERQKAAGNMAAANAAHEKANQIRDEAGISSMYDRTTGAVLTAPKTNATTNNKSSATSSSSSGGQSYTTYNGRYGYWNNFGEFTEVPKYATGAIATQPTMGIFGDVPEAIMPLAKLPALMTEALIGAVRSLSTAQPAMAGAGTGAVANSYSFSFTGPISVRDDGDIIQISRELYNLSQNASRVRGVK